MSLRAVYSDVVEDGRSESEIAETLNAGGHRRILSGRWGPGHRLHQVLTNEKIHLATSC